MYTCIYIRCAKSYIWSMVTMYQLSLSIIQYSETLLLESQLLSSRGVWGTVSNQMESDQVVGVVLQEQEPVF